MNKLSPKAQELKEKLNLIDWDIKGVYPNAWIWNHKNQRTKFWVTNEGIEAKHEAIFGSPKNRYSQGSIYFSFKASEISVLDGPTGMPECISVGTENLFVNFYNHG